MIRTIAYAAMQFAEGIGAIVCDLLDRINPPEPYPPPDVPWTDGTD